MSTFYFSTSCSIIVEKGGFAMQTTDKLMEYIQDSPSPYHAAAAAAARLEAAGFTRLEESAPWALSSGQCCYTTRNQSSLIAFRLPGGTPEGWRMTAAHSDSPTFKIKENMDIVVDGAYTELNVEKYGGMLCGPWFDRPLSVAGRVIVQDGNKLETKLVDVDRDILMLPSLAVHMNRDVNDGYKYNFQKDMLPLFRMNGSKTDFLSMIAAEAGVEKENIKGSDLFLYDRMEGRVWGAEDEFISAPRLDDLQCAFTSMKGFLKSQSEKSVSVLCVMDNEEVGSGTKQGAGSTFLYDVLRRINFSMGRSEEEYWTAVAASFMISGDNGHAVHPNYADKTDPTSRPYLNGGIVIKHSANQKYTTDAVSAAVMRCLCDRAGVPYQNFLNRSDMLGGSTLGNISNSKVSLNTVDIGLPQLAMHSSYETAGAKDMEYMVKAFEEFYKSSISVSEDGSFEIQ